ncbi:right-handed parallel beta-helix repeat-containing protein [Rhodopirellula sp. JC737]|nr:right-handed parallel beta-helix repeat-containing protein [Rhodopirellula sp. JC737]MCC9654566.1 right-handed parallel beta-helix repeat-containing protein [Rhodopirellula sp. JC737]
MLATGLCKAAEPTADFYVSPRGSDTWSGTLSEPNGLRTDGPFATLQRARDAVRKSGKNRSGDVVVFIRGGIYRLNKTVVFGVQDAPINEATITYAAYPGETPVFSSAQEISDWNTLVDVPPQLPKKAVDKVKFAVVDFARSPESTSAKPAAPSGTLANSTTVPRPFHALFDADGMLPRARSKGFIPLTGGSRNELHYPAGRLRNWPNLGDVEIVVRPHHAWIVNILPLASVDEQRQIARTSINATYAMNRLHFLKETPSCWVENVLEELDEPGEWVLDSKEGRLYLWPRNDSPVLVPTLMELIRIEGAIDKEGPEDVPVRNLCFRGLTFMHGERYSVADEDAGLQHDWEMHDKAGSLVRLRGTENCRIESCRFAHSGGGAIRIDLHGKKNTVSGNLIEHIGGTGILLCGYGPGTKDVSGKNLVTNNQIHHVGQIYSHSPGIMIWQSGENRIANNLVHHTPYTGIILSGCMTDFFRRRGRELSRTIRRYEVAGLPKQPQLEDVRPYLHTHDNVIDSNEIHHAMEMLGDGNGIYIRGAGAGNVIRRNYIHHLITPMIMQAAIRTDGGQMDTTIAENLIYKCTSQGIILKLNNRCENNIVADIIAPPRGYYLSLREGPMNEAVVKRNIFYSAGRETTFIDELPPGNRRQSEDRRGRALARAKDADTDHNIYFCVGNLELGKQMLEKQQRDGIDTHSLAVDPLFVDPANGDFRLRPDSPALKLGFVPIDLSKIGLEHEN